MIIEFEGRSHDFDIEAITVKQALKIEKYTGLTLNEWSQQMMTGDTACVHALGWLVLHDGGQTPIEDVDFALPKFAKAVFNANLTEAEKALAAEAKAAQEGTPGPTGGGNGHTPSPLPVSSPSV